MKKLNLFAILLLFLIVNIQSLEIGELFKKMDAYYDTIKDYSCYLDEVVIKGRKKTDNIWIYKFLKPRYIFMESIEGNRKGSKAFFDCISKKVTGRQGGILSRIKLTLPLTNRLVKNVRGITIAESDWFFINNRWKRIISEKDIKYRIIENDSNYILYIENIPFEKYGFDASRVVFTKNGFMTNFINYEKKQAVEIIKYTDIKLNNGFSIEDLKKNA